MSYRRNDSGIGAVIAIFAIVIVLGLFIDIMGPAYGVFGRVPTSHVGIVTTFGKMSDKTLEPGFHVKGFFDKVVSVDTRTQRHTEQIAAFSSDIQQVNLTATLNFNVDKKNAPILYREIGEQYISSLIEPRFQENVKIVFSRYNAEALIQKREILSSEVLALMIADLEPYGVNVTGVSITDIDFTDVFTNAVEAKQVATQERLTAQTQQERLTMEAEAEAERRAIAARADAEVARIEAEAKAEVEKIEADAEAYSVKVRAEAEAEANRQVAESLTPELIEYTEVNQWNGVMPTYMGNGTPILDFTE